MGVFEGAGSQYQQTHYMITDCNIRSSNGSYYDSGGQIVIRLYSTGMVGYRGRAMTRIAPISEAKSLLVDGITGLRDFV